jgi:hypothetical protein
VTLFDLQDEFVLPDYQGGSIANVPATIAALLGAPFNGLAPLRDSLWSPLAGRAKRVIVLLIDSLGWEIYQQAIADLDWLASKAVIEGKITSVFPSTTVAALSSLWTGYAPAQHGLVGLRLFLGNEAVLSSMLRFSPTFASFPDSLVDAGIKPETFLHVPGFAEQLATAGISSYSFKGHDIVHSALSRMLDRGVKRSYGIITAADMFVQLREFLESTSNERIYINAYWPAIDTLCHARGPHHGSVAAELITTIHLLKTELLDRLSAEARKDTVLFITGDHGHIATPGSRSIVMEDQPQLSEMLLMRPAGEPRTPYFYARQGCRDTLLDCLNDTMGEALLAIGSNQALSSGLFGPAPHAPDVARRVGDLMAVMRQNYSILMRHEYEKTNRMKGRHGGMSAAEMEVPWLGFALDA